ncbi:ABC transporter ATP-binding protein [Devosia submarina]|uniref:ABC transporter ATP-binding protein n=1 Tax=Devosia submarina TaxID=1173082 RepID=UPI001AECD8D6|nr:ABC transporter ATP-binding protein [Devosia submarina]
MIQPIIELIGVTKRFGSFVANDAIDLRINEGEIHAIVGENGAGKSTLMKTLAGLHVPEEGRVLLRGQDVELRNPEIAMSKGIAMVHQHFSLIDALDVAENVVISDPPRRFGVLRRKVAVARVVELSRTYGLDVDPKRRVAECRVGVQQRVEILKALYRSPEVLILDEPTAVLTPQETQALIDNLRGLREKGKTIIFITHKLKEVMAVADRVTVMRAGSVVLNVPVAETNSSALANAMVGRSISVEARAKTGQLGAELARLEEVCRDGTSGSVGLDHVSLTLRRGEVVGIAGVEGNGQSELIEVITGMHMPAAGRVILQGEDVTSRASPLFMRQRGIAHIPEDRIATGLATTATLLDNLITGAHGVKPIARGPWIDQASARAHAQRLVREFDVRPGNIAADAGSLSGGNMQKAIIARELEGDPQIIVAAHPTRGVDIGAAEFVYSQLLARRERACVLLVSSDLDEILRLSDRILVMYRGAVIAESDADSLTTEQLGLLMAGIRREPQCVADAQGAAL